MSLLSVKNLGKAYRVYASEFQRIGRWFGISTKPKEEHWSSSTSTFRFMLVRPSVLSGRTVRANQHC